MRSCFCNSPSQQSLCVQQPVPSWKAVNAVPVQSVRVARHEPSAETEGCTAITTAEEHTRVKELLFTGVLRREGAGHSSALFGSN